MSLVVKSGRTVLVLVLTLSFSVLPGCVTPPPVTSEQLADQGRTFFKQVDQQAQEDIRSYTLESALAGALNQNLEFKLHALQSALASGDSNLAKMDMLPRLTAQAGYTRRSNLSGSFSQSVATGQVSLVPSTSQERTTRTHVLEASWNMLDVGLAWFRARARAEEVNLADEERRRAIHMITRDLVYAWQRAASYQAVRDEVGRIDALVREALEKSTEIMRQRLRDPVQVLDYRKSLLLVLKRINAITREMESAEAELARLLGLPAGVSLDLVNHEEPFASLRDISAPLEVWQGAALLYRPEVRSAWYEVRNARQDGWRQLVQTLPQVVFSYGRHYNSNRFLLNNDWRETGVDLSWDLIQLASYPLHKQQADLREQLAETRRDLQITAVLSQVAIARSMLETSFDAYCISGQLAEVDQDRVSMMEARQTQATLDRLTIIKARADHLLLRVEKSLDEAERVRAIVMMLASIGVGILPPELEPGDAEGVAAALAEWLGQGLPLYLASVLQEAEQRFPDRELTSTTAVTLGGEQCFSG